MDVRARAAVEAALGATIVRTARLAGGDINDAFEVTLSDGRAVFAKTNDRADPAMFPAEARGLAWLAEARALRTPKVLAVSSGRRGEPAFLVLELLRSASPRADFDDELGRGLAALHRATPATFGLDHDNFIGRLPQPNAPLPDWASFYAERRLLAQLRAAVDARRAPTSLRRAVEEVARRTAELVGPPEPPARLHGDLWGGNLHLDDQGAPCLIDPAVHGGHRELDLAMMRLFGGFSSRTFAAYAEAHPLAAGHERRVPLYQLYFLLVHVNLFGGSYVGSAERAANAALGERNG